MFRLANGCDGDQGLTTVFDHALYTRLSSLATGFLKRERQDHGWEAGDLVHEAFLRIACSRRPVHFHSTAHAVALTGVVMRHILTDRSRSTAIFNRSRRVSLHPDLPARCASKLDGMAVRNALERLRGVHTRAYQVVEMHAIYGMGLEEVASTLSVSLRTVERDWKGAREWLGGELGDFPAHKAIGCPRRERMKTVGTVSQRAVVKPIPAGCRLADVA